MSNSHSKTTEPIVFLSFSNDKEHIASFLEEIGPERTALQRIFDRYREAGWGQYYTAGSSAIDELITDFRRYKGRIVLFHFGGHAKGTNLQIEDVHGGNESLSVKNLRELLKQETHLKLVVLNACATAEQVDFFFEIGVPAVIATKTKIDDTEAKKFAERLYGDLVDGYTLHDAFQAAKMVLAPSDGKLRVYDRSSTREFSFGHDDFSDGDGNDWGLYLNDPNMNNWTLKPENKMDEVLQKVSRFIERDQLEKALNLLLEHVEEEDYRNAFKSQKSQITKIKKKSMMGVLSTSEEFLAVNKVRAEILLSLSEWQKREDDSDD